MAGPAWRIMDGAVHARRILRRVAAAANRLAAERVAACVNCPRRHALTPTPAALLLPEKESRMKRHALFFATALAVASLGTAGFAAAQSTPAAPAVEAGDAPRTAGKGERTARPGKGHVGHRGGHAMRGGIERMDADGDGRISRAEFDAAMAAREEAHAAHAAARGKAGAGEAPRHARADRPGRPARHGMARGPRMALDFDAIDANKDGYIVRGEVTAHRDRMRQQMRAKHGQRLAEAFAAADLNKDGRLSRVEVDEKMPRLSSRFAWMDDNRDGFLDRAEIEAGRQR